MYFTSYTDIPPDTDSAVFALLWGDIARALEAHPGAAIRMDTGLVPGWLCRETAPGSHEYEATAEGWAYAAAFCLGWSRGGCQVPATEEERRGDGCRIWRVAVARGVEVAHRFINKAA